MTKELFVSSTPHEIKVGLVEDDLLAEVYLERENEYTLAGSIYKGRVTRVLPGMQSAFVEIGLERDAFLYVSDFMELEDQDDLDEVPTHRSPRDTAQEHPAAQHADAVADREPQSSARGGHVETSDVTHAQAPREGGESASEPVGSAPQQGQSRQENEGGWRGRRRRRGRRGERMPESKFAKPALETQNTQTASPEPKERSGRPEPSQYPPPGYQPIMLPGESISKYQRLAKNQASGSQPLSGSSTQNLPAPPTPSKDFDGDEPLFATGIAQSEEDQHTSNHSPEILAGKSHSEPEANATSFGRESTWELEGVQAAAAGSTESYSHPTASDVEDDRVDDRMSAIPEQSDRASAAVSSGTIEEEVIDEEEADLAHYVEELEEDAHFEELEEETHAAGEYQEGPGRELAAAGETVTESLNQVSENQTSDENQNSGSFAAESFSAETIAAQGEESSDHKEEQEAEIEEAQAQAEAILAAEAVGNGTVDARVEVRAPATTAPYTQRAPRRSSDRQGQRGGRGGPRFRRREQQNVPLISDLLKEGQEILVQIAKEPIGKKGARITSHIALPGRFLVYMPTVNHTGVSRKIASEEERQRLKRIIQSERENGHGGFIVRTAAQNAPEEDLRADIRFLKGLWSEIQTRADNAKGPTLIYHDLNVVERILRDQVTSDFSAIWVDTEAEYERILRFANRFQPALIKRVKLYTKEIPLFEQFGLSDEINKALKSKVWLKSGGYIVINQTEALVAIDVNTGKYVGKTARLEDTIVKTNVDAIKEIVRQIRLRDLGGIIIIDFIDMDERRNRQKVMQALEEALRGDRAPSKVLQFNDFGLVAITRKRVKQSLERTIGSPCPYCESTGYVKSVATVCNDVYIEMRKMARHLDHADVMLRVNPDVAKALKANNGRALTEMEELTKKTVIVKSDPALHQEQFDIN
ncbi:MAG: Rne/Rng family ribonuclease [Acidobacteriales bacterium]|nr:Rne/Rng family ribonuclease [Terriglobales bacterium]